MQDGKNAKAERKKRRKRRLVTWVSAAIAVLMVLVLFLVPAVVSSAACRKMILAKINAAVDGETDFAGFSMGWWKGVKVTDFSFSDSAGQASVEIKQIVTKPHYGSLLLGNLSFGPTEIFEPKVAIDLAKDAPDRPPVSVPPVQRIDLVVTGGRLKVTDRQAKSVELSQINSRLNLRPPGTQTDFEVRAAVPAPDKQAKIQAGGRLVPETDKGWSLKGTSGTLTVDINDLDIESLGPIFALAGLDVQTKGFVEGHLISGIEDGRFENLNANVKAKNLDITGAELKGDRLRTSGLDFSVKLSQGKETINIDVNVGREQILKSLVGSVCSSQMPPYNRLAGQRPCGGSILQDSWWSKSVQEAYSKGQQK